jgi:membrane protease YdiL (CAAX protease family)
VTIAVTSVMFAISHFAPQTYVPIALVGVALGIARHASGSLLPPFLLHAAFNGLSLLAMATTPLDAADRPSPPLWVTLAGTAVTVGLAAWLWVIGARARAPDELSNEPARR